MWAEVVKIWGRARRGPVHATRALTVRSAARRQHMSLEIELADAAATEELGARLAQVVRAGDTIFLRGELGAGKTSLARGFCAAADARSTCRRLVSDQLHVLRRAVPAPPSAGGGGAAAAAGRSVRPVGSSRLSA